MELDEETRDDLSKTRGEPSELEELIQPDLGSGELERSAPRPRMMTSNGRLASKTDRQRSRTP